MTFEITRIFVWTLFGALVIFGGLYHNGRVRAAVEADGGSRPSFFGRMAAALIAVAGLVFIVGLLVALGRQ